MPKILVVEDYPDAREILRIMLEVSGYAVIEAANGNEAVKFTLENHPDLILMDISLPDLDGITATRAIRASGDHISQTPIICLTAHSSKYKEDALAAGANEVIGKPFDPLKWLSVIASYNRA
jgi:CheY-like chemotaxis protein